MPRRALRSYPTNYATDLTDEQSSERIRFLEWK